MTRSRLDHVRATGTEEPSISALAPQGAGDLFGYLRIGDRGGAAGVSVAQGLGFKLGAVAVGLASKDLDEYVCARRAERAGGAEHLHWDGGVRETDSIGVSRRRLIRTARELFEPSHERYLSGSLLALRDFAGRGLQGADVVFGVKKDLQTTHSGGN